MLKEKIDTLPSLKAVVDSHGLLAKKSLGQNFLLDKNITDKIVRMSLEAQGIENFKGSKVVEVGPGPGGLTRSILSAEPDKLTVIEMDERCIKIMQDIKTKVGEECLEIVSGDALKYDFDGGHIVSNLPYNISVPLLIKWSKDIKNFKSLTLMFQREVAERIMASTRTKDYGRISVLAQLLCKIDKLFDLSPECFTPSPKVWSTVLLIRPRDVEISLDEIAKVEFVTAKAFGQRRKMIRQSLKGMESVLESLGIAGTLRAEELTPEQFLSISRHVRA